MSYSLEEISVSHKCKRDEYIITHLLTQEVPDLHRATTQDGDGDESQSQRGTQLLEIYALEIQMYNETRNFKKLKVEDLSCAIQFTSADFQNLGNI